HSSSIDDNGSHPGRELRLTSELGQVYVRRKKSILDCVLCVLHISQMPKGPPVERREVARDNRVEFFGICAWRSVVNLSICFSRCFDSRHSFSVPSGLTPGHATCHSRVGTSVTMAFARDHLEPPGN